MIDYFRSIQAALYCLIFVAAILLSQAIIYYRKTFKVPHQPKTKTLIMLVTTACMVLSVYFSHCHPHTGLLECVFISPNEQLMRKVAIALFINTNLFLGGLHQWLYNGSIKRKFMRFFKKQFQWDLFKKLFIVLLPIFRYKDKYQGIKSITQVPLCIQIVYRALVCRILDPQLQHPSFFTFFSGILFSVSHFINYFRVQHKHGSDFALKTVGIQVNQRRQSNAKKVIQSVYNLIFGLYISHIFARQSSLISSLVLQVYANFLGYPEYFQILKGNVETDQRVRKSAIFYLIGAISCLSCCLLLV